jgi:hypothetical protein
MLVAVVVVVEVSVDPVDPPPPPPPHPMMSPASKTNINPRSVFKGYPVT